MPEDKNYKAYMAKGNWRYHKNRFLSTSGGSWHDKKPVKCVETGIMYPSIYDAANALKCTAAAVSNHLHGWSQTCKGFRFVFVNKEHYK